MVISVTSSGKGNIERTRANFTSNYEAFKSLS